MVIEIDLRISTPRIWTFRGIIMKILSPRKFPCSPRNISDCTIYVFVDNVFAGDKNIVHSIGKHNAQMTHEIESLESKILFEL